jgi:hypothetical protein
VLQRLYVRPALATVAGAGFLEEWLVRKEDSNKRARLLFFKRFPRIRETSYP